MVPKAKILAYALDPAHREGGGKAEGFALFGFQRDHWWKLALQLRRLARDRPVEEIIPSPYGVKYRITGILNAPDGRRPWVESIWIIDQPGGYPRFVTVHLHEPGQQERKGTQT